MWFFARIVVFWPRCYLYLCWTPHCSYFYYVGIWWSTDFELFKNFSCSRHWRHTRRFATENEHANKYLGENVVRRSRGSLLRWDHVDVSFLYFCFLFSIFFFDYIYSFFRRDWKLSMLNRSQLCFQVWKATIGTSNFLCKSSERLSWIETRPSVNQFFISLEGFIAFHFSFLFSFYRL